MKFKSLFCLLIILINLQDALASNDRFEIILDSVEKVLSNQDPVKAMKNTKLLMQLADTDYRKCQVLFFQAKLLRQNGIKNESIRLLLEADKLADKLEDHIWKARINGFLSTLYRESQLFEESQKHLHIAIQASKKINDENEKNKFLGNLSQERAYNALDKKESLEAIKYLKEADNYFSKLDSTNIDRNFFLATNAELISRSYFYEAKYEEALYYLKSSLKYLKNSRQDKSALEGFIKNGMGLSYFKMGKYDLAFKNFTDADSIARISQFSNLKQEVYQSFISYYDYFGDHDKSEIYHDLSKKIEETNQAYNHKTTKELLENLYENQAYLKREYQFKVAVATIFSLVFALTLFTFFYIKRKREKDTLQRQLLELKTQVLLNSLNPHFIFNILNLIDYFFYKKDYGKAQETLFKFGDLLRNVLDKSQDKFISIQDEAKLLDLFLSLEQSRKRDLFTYHIQIGEEINNESIYVPVLITQPIVENALKHGIMNLESGKGGKIDINFNIQNNSLVITIRDNGIGLQKSKELKKLNQSTDNRKHIGIDLTRKRLALLSEDSQMTMESPPEGGTLVSIKIPVIYKNVHYT
ncbi:MAG: histidine kinase [Chitinophagales bacterium]|nr:histidine kinase [Chitinophagales bacterium]